MGRPAAVGGSTPNLATARTLQPTLVRTALPAIRIWGKEPAGPSRHLLQCKSATDPLADGQTTAQPADRPACGKAAVTEERGTHPRPERSGGAAMIAALTGGFRRRWRDDQGPAGRC